MIYSDARTRNIERKREGESAGIHNENGLYHVSVYIYAHKECSFFARAESRYARRGY